MTELEKLLAIVEDVCWFDWSDNDQDAVHAINELRKAGVELQAALKFGARYVPAGHLPLPQSRQEAEMMNIVSERYLFPERFATSGTNGDRG